MTHRKLLALLSLSCLPLPALAADSLELAVRGAPSCGEWVSHRKKSDTLALGNATWVIGYLSGLGTGSGRNLFAGRDNATMFAWMDKYCLEHPLKDTAAGGAALMEEAASRKGTTK